MYKTIMKESVGKPVTRVKDGITAEAKRFFGSIEWTGKTTWPGISRDESDFGLFVEYTIQML